ncbi:MAG: hypothetical protein NTY02_14430 [Acidobacteria bacterium]|nr:hypothetical protein [Acidobacteriota bacterium]
MALAALMIVALILVPSLGEGPDVRQIDEARSHCILIGSAIIRFQTDSGTPPRWFRAVDSHTPGASSVMVLAGPGRAPEESAPGGWTTAAADELMNQLVANRPEYPLLTPGATQGWYGPYLSPGDLGPDPWNHRYFVNVGLLEGPNGRQERRRPSEAVWVLSAGPNGRIDTPMHQDAQSATLGGDDVAYRIQAPNLP